MDPMMMSLILFSNFLESFKDFNYTSGADSAAMWPMWNANMILMPNDNNDYLMMFKDYDNNPINKPY